MSVAARRRRDSLRQMFGNQPAYAPPAPLPAPEWGVSESPDPVVDEIAQRAERVVCDQRVVHREFWRGLAPTSAASQPRCLGCAVRELIYTQHKTRVEELQPWGGLETQAILDALMANGEIVAKPIAFAYLPPPLDQGSLDLDHLTVPERGTG